jgi:sugar/nucleoside kinase (ribokinase family)
MAGVIALGECMVELSLGGACAVAEHAGGTFNTAVYLSRLAATATPRR